MEQKKPVQFKAVKQPPTGAKPWSVKKAEALRTLAAQRPAGACDCGNCSY